MKQFELLQEDELRTYAKPECKYLAFESEDVVTTSPAGTNNDNGTYEPDNYDTWGVL